MTSRLRQSVAATPRQGRQSTTGPTPGRAQQQERRAQLPDYEAPAHSLNTAGQQNLERLLASRKIESFDKLIQEAIDALSENAAAINDTVREKEAVVRKDRTRYEKENTDDAGEAERVRSLEEDLERMKQKVDTMTQKMEQDLMKMIDTREYFNSIRPALQEVSNETAAYSRANATQPQPTQTRSRRRAAQNLDEDDDDDHDDEGDEEYHDFTPTDPTNATSTQRPPAPTTLFQDKLQRKKDRYQSLTKRQRYVQDNDYRSFRGVVQDARHGGEIPLPHDSTWFTDGNANPAGSAPQPGVTNAGDDSDDDLQIAKETISTKCPLTLQEFRDPLTSRKCPHSFEKEAILGMIDNPSNTMRVGGSNARGARDGQRAVQCPVPGCACTLTKNDLHSDPVLLRKIRRIQRAMAAAEEEEDEEDGEREGGRGRPQEIGSDDVDDDGYGVEVDDLLDEADARRVKMERFSGVPRGSAMR